MDQKVHTSSGDSLTVRKRSLLHILLVSVVITVSGFLFASKAWPSGMTIWLIVVVGASLFFRVRWHARRSPVVRRAATKFVVSAPTDFIIPHLPGKKYLKCRSCGTRHWAREVSGKDHAGA